MDPASNNIVTAQNKFSSQLYETVIGRQGKSNVVLSPVSIHLALLMISSGANNQTLTELVKGLGIENVPSTVDEWRQAVEPFATTFHSNLNTSILNIANNAFVEKTAALDDQYQQHVKKAFQVDVTQCDFVGNADSETNNINQWIASKTNQMIKDLIKPGILNQLTELVLVNAVHFLGKWKDAFEKNKSYPGTFYGSESTIECRFMSKTDVKTKYGTEGDFHWVTLPFTDEKYKMTIIAVKNKAQQSSLDSWVSERLTKGLDSAFPTTEQRLNRLAFPKFEVDYGLELSETLRNEPFNIKNPFTNQADFSHLIKSAKNENVSLDKIIHRAVFKVDEEGVEASAVTVGLMKSGCKSNGPQFIADSSFAFVLSDDSNKTLLFIGKVNNL